jgi:hypothetical protein
MHDSRLKIAFLSLPQRTHAVLEYFVVSTGQDAFVLSADDLSEAAIFDFDNPESRQHWAHYHAQQGKPGILLSVVAQHVPLTVWVQKPVSTTSMREAAVKIKSGACFLASQEPLPEEQPLDDDQAPEQPLEYAPPVAPLESSETELEPTLPPENAPAEALTLPPIAASLPAAEHSFVLTITEPQQPPSPLPEVDTEIVAETDSASPLAAKEKPRLEINRFIRNVQGRIQGRLGHLSGVFLRAGQSLQNRARPRRSLRPLPNSPQSTDSDSLIVSPIALEEALSPHDAVALLSKQEILQETRQETLAIVPETPANNATDNLAADPQPEASAAPMSAIKAMPSAAELADAPRYCGLREDIPAAEIPHTAELFYAYDYYLISALRETYRVGAKWRSPTRLDLDFGCLIFVPAENCAYLDFPEDALFEQEVVSPLGSQPRSPSRRHKVRMVGVQEFADFQLRLVHLTRLDRFDATLWKLGMTTAKGCLPVGTDVNKVFFLKSWPNMTRLQPSPFALRIAALWATRGASLLETARILDIPQRYVFAFYNAALATDIVTDDGEAVRRALRRSTRINVRLFNLLKWLRS